MEETTSPRRLIKLALDVNHESSSWSEISYDILKETDVAYRVQKTVQTTVEGKTTGPANIKKSQLGDMHSNRIHDTYNHITRVCWCREEDMQETKAAMVNNVLSVVSTIRNQSERLSNQANKLTNNHEG